MKRFVKELKKLRFFVVAFFWGVGVGVGVSNLKVYVDMVENKSNLVYYEHNDEI